MDENEWIQRSQQGDEEAFTALVHCYQDKIYHQCLYLIKDEELAQDLTQETFLHAFQHLATFRKESSFYTWLYRIARNLCLNFLRKRKHLEQELKEETIAAVEYQEEHPIDEAFQAALQEAIERLPPKQRVVFELFDLQKLPHKEIAAQLNVSTGTVRSRLYYARKKIREFLQKSS